MFQGRLISTLPSSVSAFIILAQGSASSYLSGLKKSPCKTFPKLSHVISKLRIKLQAWAVPHAITSYCFTLLLLLSSVFGSTPCPNIPSSLLNLQCCSYKPLDFPGEKWDLQFGQLSCQMWFFQYFFWACLWATHFSFYCLHYAFLIC